jgi:hypothetical protein
VDARNRALAAQHLLELTGKYFFNSVREDGLVTIASGGIVFGPGKADYWNPPTFGQAEDDPASDDQRKPVWPLISALDRLDRRSQFASATHTELQKL